MYQTLETLGTHELVLKDLEVHIAVHVAGVAAVTGSKAMKLE